jgi:hypothetical protein
VARSLAITSGIAADEVVVRCWFVHDGDDCIGAVDEETGAFGDEA